MLFAAGTDEAALAFIEIGALILALALLSRFAGRFGISAIPLYLIAGLAMGEGGLVQLDVSVEFFEIAAEIGVLLLLFALGLEYSDVELRSGLAHRSGPRHRRHVAQCAAGRHARPAAGWDPIAAVLLGGVTWISSSGVVSKVLSDLGRLGNRETPAVLNILVMEDLAMAIYLPVVAALIVGGSLTATVTSVLIALAAVTVILLAALRYGRRIERAGRGRQRRGVPAHGVRHHAPRRRRRSAAGSVRRDRRLPRGAGAVGPGRDQGQSTDLAVRDLFAATFFLFFSFQIDPADLLAAIVPAAGLFAFTACTKVATGWYRQGEWAQRPRAASAPAPS